MWFSIFFFVVGCSSRNYTYYLLDAPVQRHAALKEEGTPLRAYGAGSATALKVRWNDGKVLTEVDLPLVALDEPPLDFLAAAMWGLRIVLRARMRSFARFAAQELPTDRLDATFVKIISRCERFAGLR